MSFKISLLAAALCCAASMQTVAAEATSPLTVSAPAGKFHGKTVQNTTQFQGIPYARPPVGERRWTAPIPVDYLSDFDATSFQSMCTQPGSLFGGDPDNTRGSEDCLYLNVYKPEGAEKNLPVMVWIHGGGFITGSGDQFDPTKLTASENVITVSLNYRLGPLGFLSLPEMGDAAGNFGALDQQLAMKWVKDNIEAFGGNPDNITIFGESAGGMSVGVQLLMPGSANLFDKAIMQSGPFLTGPLLKTAENANKQGMQYTGNIGCSDSDDVLKCLRQQPAGKVTTASGAAQAGLVTEWSPAYRTKVIPLTAKEALASGEFNQVPVINGTNADEGNLFAYYIEKSGALSDYANVRKMLISQYGEAHIDQIEAAYPLDSYRSAAHMYGVIMTDAVFSCPVYETNLMLSAHVPTYAYEFTDQHAPINQQESEAIGNFGAYHASDIVYVFQTDFDLASPDQLSPAQLKLSDQFQRYWANFARRGTPNDGEIFKWQQARGEAMPLIDLNPEGLTMRDADTFVKAHHCDVWADIL